MLEYSGLGLLSFLYFLTKKHKNSKAALFALIFSVLFAISDELHQHFTPDRDCDIWDVITDAVGSTFAIISALVVIHLTKITINN